MRDPFSLQLRRSADSVELAYPVAAAGYGALVGLVLLGMLYSVVGFAPSLHAIWVVILDLTLVAIALNAVRLIWLSTVRFDFARDQVRHGLQTVASISDIQWVEPGPEERAALRLVLVDEGRQVRRW